MNIRQAFDYAKKNSNIEIERVKILLKSITNLTEVELVIKDEYELNANQEADFKSSISLLNQGYPVQYITNKQNFFGMELYVDENVLIPQPDTEVVVEKALEVLNKHNSNMAVLDLCTGSGAIAISIAKNSSAKVWASDISKKALEVAKKNAQNQGVKIEFVQSDLFESIGDIKFDLIISNPPYIETEVIDSLDREVQNEPHIALDGGLDGLDFYRKISNQAKQFLSDNGCLILEIGYNQKESIEEILKNSFADVKTYKDYAGNDRVVIAK